MAGINEIRVGMGVFSSGHSRIGTVHEVETDRISMLGDPDTDYADGHYHAAIVLIRSVSDGRIILSEDAEAALILQEAYSEGTPGRNRSGGRDSTFRDSSSAAAGRGSHRRPSSGSVARPSTEVVLGFAILGAIAGGAIPFMLGGRRRTETRLQRGGEAATTRFGMEDTSEAEIPATGGPSLDEAEVEAGRPGASLR